LAVQEPIAMVGVVEEERSSLSFAVDDFEIKLERL
jgi:hypothetical protein